MRRLTTHASDRPRAHHWAHRLLARAGGVTPVVAASQEDLTPVVQSVTRSEMLTAPLGADRIPQGAFCAFAMRGGSTPRDLTAGFRSSLATAVADGGGDVENVLAGFSTDAGVAVAGVLWDQTRDVDARAVLHRLHEALTSHGVNPESVTLGFSHRRPGAGFLDGLLDDPVVLAVLGVGALVLLIGGRR